nr:response regulator transcription factor [uncultured Fluviicola sp.]
MKPATPNILLVEDDPNLGLLLLDLLQTEGFNVKLIRDGESALTHFKKGAFSLCLLDIMLPNVDGYTIANEIRLIDPDLPIIFMTAKALKEDKLKAYQIGADDYIVKPFDEEELIWKIKAFVKRVPIQTKSSIPPTLIGHYTFDYENLSLSDGKHTQRITSKEGELLLFLVSNKNKLVKREEILLQIWGQNDYFMGRSLDVFITKLRKYLKGDPHIKIENVFNVGFIFKVNELK